MRDHTAALLYRSIPSLANNAADAQYSDRICSDEDKGLLYKISEQDHSPISAKNKKASGQLALELDEPTILARRRRTKPDTMENQGLARRWSSIDNQELLQAIQNLSLETMSKRKESAMEEMKG
jgi:hypothetical protein